MAVHGSRQRQLLQLALILLLGTAGYWIYSHQDELSTASWLSQQQGFLEVLSHEPILGNTEDLSRFYYPPTSSSRPLQIAQYAQPPPERPRTPLFIGFTNNNAMLYQCVLSYIAAGWPPEDIIVVENTGTMDSNPLGKLAKDNYFYLDYKSLRKHGVSILQTPTLFTFAQLQNFFIRTSIAHGWKNFFWSHMDVLVVGDEAREPFRSFYQRVVDVVEEVQYKKDWAIKWFSCTMGLKACDMLVLVNIEAWRKIGAWDQFIPYYATDCDAFSRMVLSGYSRASANDHGGIGHIFDTGTLLKNPEEWLFPTSVDEEHNSPRFQKLFKKLEEMESTKLQGDDHRNDWQENHGKDAIVGDWTYHDRKAFRAGWWALSDAGRGVYVEKWGTDECELEEIEGLGLGDMWKPREKKED